MSALPGLNELSPFFRIVNELERASRQVSSHPGGARSFAPRFDIRETKETYELHGELPGIEQSKINIEWADDTTLTISGHTERNYSTGDAEAIEQSEGEGHGSTSISAKTEQTVTKTSKQEIAWKPSRGSKYLVTERSVGSFHRTFQFPSRIDHDLVKASLKNGVLNITVPKAKAREPRRVNIE